MPIITNRGRVVTYCERHPLLKLRDPFIMWPTWGHVTFWKNYISYFTRLMVTKLARVLTSRRMFSTQTLMSSLTSCFHFDTLTKQMLLLFQAILVKGLICQKSSATWGSDFKKYFSLKFDNLTLNIYISFSFFWFSPAWDGSPRPMENSPKILTFSWIQFTLVKIILWHIFLDENGKIPVIWTFSTKAWG